MGYDPGKVSDKRRIRLAAAADVLRAAEAERAAAIIDALEHGGSFRVIADIMGMSVSGVRAIAQRAGYTSDKFFEARRRQREAQDRDAEALGMPELRSKPDGTERKGPRRGS